MTKTQKEPLGYWFYFSRHNINVSILAILVPCHNSTQWYLPFLWQTQSIGISMRNWFHVRLSNTATPLLESISKTRYSTASGRKLGRRKKSTEVSQFVVPLSFTCRRWDEYLPEIGWILTTRSHITSCWCEHCPFSQQGGSTRINKLTPSPQSFLEILSSTSSISTTGYSTPTPKLTTCSDNTMAAMTVGDIVWLHPEGKCRQLC